MHNGKGGSNAGVGVQKQELPECQIIYNCQLVLIWASQEIDICSCVSKLWRETRDSFANLRRKIDLAKFLFFKLGIRRGRN